MTDYNKIEIAKNVIAELLEKCGVPASVEFEESITKGLVFNIATTESYLLIGRQGITLHSLQILSQALVAKKLNSQEPFWFTLDVDDYKRKREWLLKETAKAAADKAKLTGRAQALEPMPNYERRLIHAYLQEHCPEVYSDSIGNEPYRKVVIRLKR
ncbi:MAG: R3H domain-containing nucleic acid-binding protein [Candidatus Doudnabacteria bacterium]|nr:R3H domain-containing nucleic acid-binding protein [Candidatus Doudnabacteria bacterium]